MIFLILRLELEITLGSRPSLGSRPNWALFQNIRNFKGIIFFAKYKLFFKKNFKHVLVNLSSFRVVLTEVAISALHFYDLKVHQTIKYIFMS